MRRQGVVNVLAVAVMLASLPHSTAVLRAQDGADAGAEVPAPHAELLKRFDRAYDLFQSGALADAENLASGFVAEADAALGASHSGTRQGRMLLGAIYFTREKYVEAEAVYEGILSSFPQPLDADDPIVHDTLSNATVVMTMTGRSAEALPIIEKLFQTEPAAEREVQAQLLAAKAEALLAMGLPDLAEAPAEQALADLLQGASDPSAPKVNATKAKRRLARVFAAQHRHLDYARLLLEVVSEYAERGDFIRVARTETEIAIALNRKQMSAEALKLVDGALALEKELAELAPDVLVDALNQKGQALIQLGSYDEAAGVLSKAVAIARSGGSDEQRLATALNNLGFVYRHNKDPVQAKVLLQEALVIRSKYDEAENTSISDSLGNIAAVDIDQGNWQDAYDALTKSAARVVSRLQLLEASSSIAAAQAVQGDFTNHLRALVAVGHRLGADNTNNLNASFEAAQWSESSRAARALQLLVSRLASGNDDVAAAIRRWQDLKSEQALHSLRLIDLAAAGEDGPKTPEGRSNAAAALRQAMAANEGKIREIESTSWPETSPFAHLVRLDPISIDETQAVLDPNEVLIFLLGTEPLSQLPAETHLWIVTKSSARWLRIEMSETDLAQRVQAMRCGLDYSQWGNDEASARCAALLGLPMGTAFKTGDPLPFVIKQAHEFYDLLLGKAGGLLKNEDGTPKQIIAVLSGPLTQLPLNVLVTEPPATDLTGTEALRQAKWLGTQHPITVLPSVASLKALRTLTPLETAAAGRRTYAAFANPLLDGDPGDKGQRHGAIVARKTTNCTQATVYSDALYTLLGAGASGQQARLTALRNLTPAPETAMQACNVAETLEAGEDDVYLGARATEKVVKDLSHSGKLASFNIVNFATHGTVAGEIAGFMEPGLILTPPQQASTEDDGYLSASEVASLKLDADWVLLSACNTAAGGADRAEALAGLARAFIYAGARALLVSHWVINERGSVKLVTGAMKAAIGGAASKSEALRLSMEALVINGSDAERQPAYWAPFVLVGDGRS